MLRELRQKASNLVVKIILGLLVISFGAWGVGDMLKFRSGDLPVAEIGSREITRGELEDEVRREIARLNPQFGNQLTPDTARMLGLPRSILGRMINQSLLLKEADGLDVAVSDNLVRDQVHANPMFRSNLGAGGFDREKFQSVLYRVGMTEGQYIAELRKEIARAQLTDSVETGVVAPDVFADLVYRFREEQRVAETLFVNDSAAQLASQPTDDDLKAYYKDHPAPFTAPEYRAITLAVLHASDLADPAAVTEEQIKKAFEDHADTLGVPEKRKLQQMFLPDKATADKARAAIMEGHDFLAVAKDMAGMDADGVNLGEVTKSDVLEEIAKAAFSAPAGAITDPLPGPGGAGFYLVKVVSVTPGHQPKLEDVKDQLRQRVAKEKSIDALYALVNKLEDEMGKTGSLDEAARTLNIKTVKIAGLDRAGKTPDGKPAAGLPEGDEPIITTAFDTESGTDSTIRELGDSAFFALHVDGVTAPALRPFDSVKDKVKEAVLAERRRDATLAFAKQIAERLKHGEDAQAVAKDTGAAYAETKPVKRYYSAKVAGIPNQLLQDIFGLKDKDAAVTRGEIGYYISRVKQVIPADPAKDKAGLLAAQDELAGQERDDVLTQLAAALRKKHSVTVNEDVLRKILSGGPDS